MPVLAEREVQAEAVAAAANIRTRPAPTAARAARELLTVVRRPKAETAAPEELQVTHGTTEALAEQGKGQRHASSGNPVVNSMEPAAVVVAAEPT